MSPVLLDNSVQHYAWGSRTVIPDLVGAPSPADQPWAELWMGAHERAPSRLPDGRSLRDVVPDLPFLLKVLAVEEPLSLQAHPSADDARRGFAAEEAAGVPLGAPSRNYTDPNPKPELFCALTPVEALCGFRRPDATRRLVEGLGVPDLSVLTEPLLEADVSSALRATFTGLMTLPRDRATMLVPEVAAAAQRVLAAAEVPRSWALPLSWTVRLASSYPDDVGVLSALMLDVVTLAPGEAVFLPAGHLHAYLKGAGVEVMASSDNVLRGGLTPKHIDVPELMTVLDFEVAERRVVQPEKVGPGEWVYPTQTSEFVLRRIDVEGSPVRPDARGPRIVLCLEGSVDASGLEVRRGCSAFVAEGEPLVLDGSGTVYLASPGG